MKSDIQVGSQTYREEMFSIFNKLNETFDIHLNNFINSKDMYPNDLATIVIDLLVNFNSRNIIKMNKIVSSKFNQKNISEKDFNLSVKCFIDTLLEDVKRRVATGELGKY